MYKRISLQEKSLLDKRVSSFVDLNNIDVSSLDCESLWIDEKSDVFFGSCLNYTNNIQEGAFLDNKDGYLENIKYGPSCYQSRKLSEISAGDECLLSKEAYVYGVDLLRKYENSNILIFGAGPSAKMEKLWKPKINEYDYLWSCNSFYKPSFLEDLKFDLVSIGNEVNLYDHKFLNRIKRDQSLICMNLNISRDISNVSSFKSGVTNDLFFYSTRYFGKIGTIPRMIVLASLLKPRKIGFVGFDGRAPPEVIMDTENSVFEPEKGPFHARKGTNDYSLIFRHYVTFWSYIFDDLKIHNKIQFENLGSKYENNLTKKVWSFVNEEY